MFERDSRHTNETFERDSRHTNETFERDSHLNKSIWPSFQGVLGRREGADSFPQQSYNVRRRTDHSEI